MYTEWHLGSIANTLSPEFDVKLEEGPAAVMVMQVPEVTDLLNLHGIDAAKEVSEGGRVELRLQVDPHVPVGAAPANQEDERQAPGLRLDLRPFKASFPSTQDLPARSAGIAMILAHAQRLCVEFGIAVLVISHVSIDPIKAWDRVPYGGVILGHDAKFSLELTKATATRNAQGTPSRSTLRTRRGRRRRSGSQAPRHGGVLQVRICEDRRGRVPLMGWLFKGLLVILALVLFGTGIWWVSAIILVYLFFSWRSGRRKGERTIVVAPRRGEDYISGREGGKRSSRLGFRWRWRYLLGGLCLLAAYLGLAAHGTSLSPRLRRPRGAVLSLVSAVADRARPCNRVLARYRIDAAKERAPPVRMARPLPRSSSRVQSRGGLSLCYMTHSWSSLLLPRRRQPT